MALMALIEVEMALIEGSVTEEEEEEGLLCFS